MSATPFDAIVFDLDGTLVQSAAAKRQAFFAIFPPEYAPAVAAVLANDPDGSRYRVIPEMIAEAWRRGLHRQPHEPEALVEAYGEMAAAGTAAAPEMPGASLVLRTLSRSADLYVASVTPHETLRQLLSRRGWLDHLAGFYGYPHDKSETVAALLTRHAIDPSRLLVVGDGPGDRAAAARSRCRFHAITGLQSLMALPALEECRHV